MDQKQSWIESNMPDQIITIKESINNEIAALINLPLEVKNEKNENIKSMISYYTDQTKTIEDRRSRLAEFAWQTLAISVAASAIIISLSLITFVKGLLLIIFGVIITLHFMKLIEYQVQSAFRYSFLQFPEFGNQWKWSYYGNPYIPRIVTNPYTQRKSFRGDQLNYLQGFNKFVGDYTEETIDKELQGNINQLYLLQVHNFYKNRFYLRLLKYDQYTPLFILIMLLLYVIVVILLSYISPGYGEYFFR